MRSLASWSGWRIAAAWAVWLLGVVLAVVGSVAVLVWRAHRLESGSTRLPPQGSDFAISFVSSELWSAAALILAPPLLLTAVWLWRRSGGR